MNIGTIESPRPTKSAQQVVAEMRAEAYRQRQLS